MGSRWLFGFLLVWPGIVAVDNDLIIERAEVSDARSPSAPFLSDRTSPSAMHITIVEAKKEDIISGLGQCVSEMLGAQLFNEREGNEIKTIYGVVTSGTIWRFLKLEDKVIYIDVVEYYIKEVKKIRGILFSSIKQNI